MVTLSVCCGGGRLLNRAPISIGAEAVTEQVVPEHADAKPSNWDVASGVAVNVSGVPTGTLQEHTPGQSIPEGVETMRPAPEPMGITVIAIIAAADPESGEVVEAPVSPSVARLPEQPIASATSATPDARMPSPSDAKA